MPKRLTNSIFIKRANQVHDYFYDYSHLNYRSLREKIKIVCPIHGSFLQYAGNHLDGHGCKKCSSSEQSKKNTLTKNKFIKKATSLHGNNYDYSLVRYISAHKKVEIICPTHGVFSQTPSNHFQAKVGCPKCGIVKKNQKISASLKTNYKNNPQILRRTKVFDSNFRGEFFISRLKKFHGDKYDLSKVIYKNSLQNVEIICKKHGSFFALPSRAHIYGCPKCGDQSSKRRNKQNNVIKNFIKIHGDKYDYSRVIYESMDKKVEIICEKHGSFFVKPNSHIHLKSECMICSQEKQRISLSDFKKISNAIHDSKYDYSLANFDDYIENNKKIAIVCPEHGVFKQNHNTHIRGSGCPSCGNIMLRITQNIEKIVKTGVDIPAILYEIEIYNDFEHFYKIGVTLHNAQTRFKNSNLIKNYQYEVINEFQMGLIGAYKTEQRILAQYKDFQYIPKEHFEGYTECFIEIPSVLDKELRSMLYL